MQTAILIIVWAISVYLSFISGRNSGKPQGKNKNVKRVAQQTEEQKRLKIAEQRFWHFDGSSEDNKQ